MHALQQHLRRHHAHARCGQFDRQRQAIERFGELVHRAAVCRVRRKTLVGRLGPPQEEFHGVVAVQRRQCEHRLAGDAQHFAAGDEELSLRRTAQPRAQRLFGVARHLLEVVKDQQYDAAAGDGVANLHDRIAATQVKLQALRHGMDNAVEVQGLRKIAKPDAAGVAAQRIPTVVQRQPRLAGAADAQHRNQTGFAGKGGGQIGQGLAPADEAVALGLQAVRDFAAGQPTATVVGDAPSLVGVRRRA